MKRILLTLLGLVVVIGMFSAAGYAGYRRGLAQGAERTVDNDMPRLHLFDEFGPRAPRMHDFEFHGGFRRGLIGIPERGFGLFFLFRLLFWLATLTLVLWLIAWLFARSGWRLVRETGTPPAPIDPVEPAAPKPENE